MIACLVQILAETVDGAARGQCFARDGWSDVFDTNAGDPVAPLCAPDLPPVLRQT
jgi:hypothetical protein